MLSSHLSPGAVGTVNDPRIPYFPTSHCARRVVSALNSA
jgi:hypothetical protein